MAAHHRLLDRQLRRHLGADERSPALDALLAAVSDAYAKFDEDRLLLQRSLELSSAELLEANRELKGILDALPDQVLLIDAQDRLLDSRPSSSGASIFWGASPVGAPLLELVAEPMRERLKAAIDAARRGPAPVCVDLVDASEGGESHFEVRLFCLTEGRVSALVRDISERKRSEMRIAQLAYQDSLTGLPNRLAFHDHLTAAVAQAEASGAHVALLFLDVDRFKAVNDTFGQGAGDQLLVEVARRLRGTVRSGDLVELGAGQPTVARMGGDEFTLILRDVRRREDIAAVCGRLLDVLARPFELPGAEIAITASIGVALFPEHGATADVLVRNADTAMYHSKGAGRSTFQIYDASMNAQALEKLQMESALRRAIPNNELSLNYQPIRDLTTGRIASTEVLLRWTHPTRGPISPAIFIPVAEESDLILTLGEWVLRETCRQLRRWADAGLRPPRAAVNLSSRLFWRRDVIEMVKGALEEAGIPPRLLGVELTETSMMQNPEYAAVALSQLRAMGITVSLDDFGTGYSSLGYLKRFQVDTLKIDRSFVSDLCTDPDAAALVRAIIAMAHSLGLAVVAEGAETADQIAFLQAHACDYAQGYYICRPVPPGRLVEFLTEQRDARRLQLAALGAR